MAKRSTIPRVLLLIDTAHAYGRGIVEGVARYALENGPWSIQFEEHVIEAESPSWLSDWRGSGIIVRTSSRKLNRWLEETGLPRIELHGGPRLGMPQVRSDGVLAGRMVVEHFLNCGLRHFAHFSVGEAWWIGPRREDYRGAVEASGFTCHVYEPAAPNHSGPVWNERQRPRLGRWLRSLPRPIGICTASDLHAARLLDVCREMNIAVPEEVAIAGVGNDPVICEAVRPTLTSLDLDARRVGFEAARLLADKMAGRAVAEVVHVPPSRVAVRGSTDLMVIEDADIMRAMRFIRDNACAGIDVSRVAHEVGLSLSALERRFQQQLGRTPKTEIMRHRIEHAKELLAQVGRTSKSVAFKCGFNSLAAFTNAFRSKVGMTPSAYRRLGQVCQNVESTAQ
jgi:LacI family transcriptional regulator